MIGRMKHVRNLLLSAIAFSACTLPVHAYEFYFARLMYSQGGATQWARWRADWPAAEQHFCDGLERLTRLHVAPEGVLMRMNDDKVFDYPWLYVVEVGFWRLSAAEIDNLREYLLRGGFLMVDDFHGEQEWNQFEQVMSQVFPERRIIDLEDTAEAFHVLYDLAKREQIPGINALINQRTYEKGGVIPRWRGILDDQQRLMVAINFNQDIGDAWEHADERQYPAVLTSQAYRLGVNYVLYAMTH